MELNARVRSIRRLKESSDDLEKRVEERTSELAAARRYVDNVISSIPDTLIVIDPEGRISRTNQPMTGLLGYEQEELIGRSADAVLGAGFLENARMHDLQVEGLVWNLETVLFRKDGREVPVILSGTRLRGTDDSDSGLVCVAKDIIERVRAEQQIRELAFYDVLTGLPNRRLMLDRIHSALKWAKQRDT